MRAGLDKAWDILNGLDPGRVSKNAGAAYDAKNHCYAMASLGMDFSVCPGRREILSLEPRGDVLLTRHGYFFILSVLHYLINARDIGLSGRLVNPGNIRGGDIFFRGSHVLPLDNLAEKYGNNVTSFIEKGRSLAGRTSYYGDASIELLPLPRIPVVLILWLADEEFPARVDLLLDSTCEQHLPLDIIWSVAMMSALVMM